MSCERIFAKDTCNSWKKTASVIIYVPNISPKWATSTLKFQDPIQEWPPHNFCQKQIPCKSYKEKVRVVILISNIISWWATLNYEVKGFFPKLMLLQYMSTLPNPPAVTIFPSKTPMAKSPLLVGKGFPFFQVSEIKWQ